MPMESSRCSRPAVDQATAARMMKRRPRRCCAARSRAASVTVSAAPGCGSTRWSDVSRRFAEVEGSAMAAVAGGGGASSPNCYVSAAAEDRCLLVGGEQAVDELVGVAAEEGFLFAGAEKLGVLADAVD